MVLIKTYIVGITGASGSAYGLRAARALLERGNEVRLVVTDSGRAVLLHELGYSLEDWAGGRTNLILESNSDLFSKIASGSFSCAGMAVAPCSMSTLGALAAGYTPNLLTRAADATLKQKRPLVLMPRETPLSAIHLRNMLTLSECGAHILPAMPGFYQHPQSVDDIIDFMAGKLLDCLGVENKLYTHWKEE